MSEQRLCQDAHPEHERRKTPFNCPLTADTIESLRKFDEVHQALFQREDREANQPAGVIQLLARLDSRTTAIEIANDRQKRFIGGFLFAFSCVGFFFTDTAHKVVGFFRGL